MTSDLLVIDRHSICIMSTSATDIKSCKIRKQKVMLDSTVLYGLRAHEFKRKHPVFFICKSG